ncbi:uncharacterized protein M421DRAFT_97107 [Didymella exigua CBS 183.55]|uniref:Endonuclease/exonuclease/phosphatase domain-containing protein n=1 Tax=Didymella exigua CBS 183.55 TaxID=1150837 RepID=A0A6A5S304_9PLEO|nr:uncharacterized protein M421DRAFT_97107 [Didymella exigua CBS 183.55]KAF1934129.1 hypothetical protein M421DRAFT_97107 [Didymella exigua CBS 183.55]
MATLLRDPQVREYDILAIQEPWKNLFTATTHHPAKDVFHLCCLTGDEKGPARVCFFINKKIDHKQWRFSKRSRDICSLVIKPSKEQQDRQQLLIHNIYNQGGASASEETAITNIRPILDRY